MLKPDIAVYRLVSRQTKAAKVSPMKGSFTSAFVFFIRREYTIHASSKKQKPYPKGKAKKTVNFSTVTRFILADLSGSP